MALVFFLHQFSLYNTLQSSDHGKTPEQIYPLDLVAKFELLLCLYSLYLHNQKVQDKLQELIMAFLLPLQFSN